MLVKGLILVNELKLKLVEVLSLDKDISKATLYRNIFAICYASKSKSPTS